MVENDTLADEARETRLRIARHLAELHRLHLSLAQDSRALKRFTSAGRPGFEIEIAAELIADADFREVGAETRLLGLAGDRRPAGFLPLENVVLSLDVGGDMDLALFVAERTVLGRVGRQFVNQQAEAEGLACTISDALEVFRRLVAAYNRRSPDDTGLFYAYLLSDPVCWDDWLASAHGVVERVPRSG